LFEVLHEKVFADKQKRRIRINRNDCFKSAEVFIIHRIKFSM